MPTKTSPRFVVAGSAFVWRSDDPEVGEVKIPLKFKTKILRASREMQGDELGFIFFVLDSVINDPAITAQVDEMDAGEMRAMFRDWQKEWERKADAAFPES